MTATQNARVRGANRAPVNPAGEYILYWMTAYRRTSWNHSLDRAIAWARELNKPLLVLEALRCDYPWASDRFHRFVLDGMADNTQAFSGNRVAYYPYVEPLHGAGKGLLVALAARACVVVTDDYPAFFIPRMISAAAGKLNVLLEAVDSNGLIPLSNQAKVYSSAHQLRRFVHSTLANDPLDFPRQRPFAGRQLPAPGELPRSVVEKWPPTTLDRLARQDPIPAPLPIDHRVSPTRVSGGQRKAKAALKAFLETGLLDYAALHNHPEAGATSGLSPFLHFGHMSSHEVAAAVLGKQQWTPDRIEPAATGNRTGWWGLDENAEAFLDELIIWRELGFNAAKHQPGFDSYTSLPAWAQTTLAAHTPDIRDHIYTPDQFEQAATRDPIWNAAQRQLLTEGVIHGYLRMLWGKKILEWSPTPRHAFDIMVELNNKYALDGRDPNSYSGILWVLGKYDRPWGPERPIFGKVRYMSSENTARKFRLENYLRRYGP